ncbi:GNAT superfamily N-acetyltransferase [Kitasatospora gansuensis]|uniref:GNAT superfamily N-acetyltransferase n=1 Tax=Kitasatospora gansuensis TaxID=258050 RepID=A0A7W7SL50_9ACTN|nr:GNAT family N-acetyltransferase [Kitasatospora gansuensis]MBB4951296.1 GNAT superfamily N-acetyltransferase [Kitasatospora gansuensis]
MTVELRHHRDLTPEVRQDLLEAYADVRAPLLHLANYRVEAFVERLDRHATEPGFELVLGYDGQVPVGYAYGNTVDAGDRYWRRMSEPLPVGFTDTPVLAIKEIGVRTPWRGTGTARRIHDGLLTHRGEDRVALMVNPLAGDGKVLRLYEAWGYQAFNVQQSSADSPRLIAMVRPQPL